MAYAKDLRQEWVYSDCSIKKARVSQSNKGERKLQKTFEDVTKSQITREL